MVTFCVGVAAGVTVYYFRSYVSSGVAYVYNKVKSKITGSGSSTPPPSSK